MQQRIDSNIDWATADIDQVCIFLDFADGCYNINFNISRVTHFTRVGTLIVATIYLQLIQIRYMFRSFTVPQCSHQHCVQPVASDVEVVG